MLSSTIVFINVSFPFRSNKLNQNRPTTKAKAARKNTVRSSSIFGSAYCRARLPKARSYLNLCCRAGLKLHYETIPLGVEGSNKTKSAVLASSRKQYAVSKKTVEKYLEKLFEETPKKQNSKTTKTTKASKDSGSSKPKIHGAWYARRSYWHKKEAPRGRNILLRAVTCTVMLSNQNLSTIKQHLCIVIIGVNSNRTLRLVRGARKG